MTDLPPFSGADAICPKCGGARLRIRWEPNNETCSVLDQCHSELEGTYTTAEHLHLDCKRCGYFWLAAPRDATPADDDELAEIS